MAEDKAIAEKLLSKLAKKPVVKSFRKGVTLPPRTSSSSPDYSIKGKRNNIT